MEISDIIYRSEYIFSEIDENIAFEKITTDVGDMTEGDILIIPNSNKMPDLSRAKALPLAIICDTEANISKEIPTIRVSDPRLATANAFFRFEKIDLSGVKLVGVTGTNGKTTTASLIKEIFEKTGHRVGFIGTGKIKICGEDLIGQNYSMTTPDPPLLYRAMGEMIRQGCDVIVMEVSSHALALGKVAPLTFDVGVFTNLSPEHLDFHGDQESYFSAKTELFKKSKCSVFNIDDPYGRKAYSLCRGRKISAGIVWRGDVWVSNVENLGFDGIRYIYHGRNFSFNLNLPLPGIYNSYNSMLAATVCIECGCKPCRVKSILGECSAIGGRYEIINDGISVIIDYAHTSGAFEAILRELHRIKKTKSLTVVFGCGGDRDKSKRPKMAKTAEKYADRIIVTEDNSRSEDTMSIIADITAGFEMGSYEVKEKREAAIFSAIVKARDGDIVAIIGKGPEKYNIDSRGYHPLDEREIIYSALKLRNEEKNICG